MTQPIPTDLETGINRQVLDRLHGKSAPSDVAARETESRMQPR